MAATIKIFRFTYENGDEFKLEQSIDGGDYTNIIEMKENGDIGSLFDKGITASINSFFATKIAEIVDAMKA